MRNLIKMVSFYLALIFWSLIPASCAATAIPMSYLEHSVRDAALYSFIAIFVAVFIGLYSRANKTYRASIFSNEELTPGLVYIFIGHLGPAYCILAIAAMIAGKSGSGIALIPGLAWSLFFYGKGFFNIHQVLRKAAPNKSSQPTR